MESLPCVKYFQLIYQRSSSHFFYNFLISSQNLISGHATKSKMAFQSTCNLFMVSYFTSTSYPWQNWLPFFGFQSQFKDLSSSMQFIQLILNSCLLSNYYYHPCREVYRRVDCQSSVDSLTEFHVVYSVFTCSPKQENGGNVI